MNTSKEVTTVLEATAFPVQYYFRLTSAVPSSQTFFSHIYTYIKNLENKT